MQDKGSAEIPFKAHIADDDACRELPADRNEGLLRIARRMWLDFPLRAGCLVHGSAAYRSGGDQGFFRACASGRANKPEEPSLKVPSWLGQHRFARGFGDIVNMLV